MVDFMGCTKYQRCGFSLGRHCSLNRPCMPQLLKVGLELGSQSVLHLLQLLEGGFCSFQVCFLTKLPCLGDFNYNFISTNALQPLSLWRTLSIVVKSAGTASIVCSIVAIIAEESLKYMVSTSSTKLGLSLFSSCSSWMNWSPKIPYYGVDVIFNDQE